MADEPQTPEEYKARLDQARAHFARQRDEIAGLRRQLETIRLICMGEAPDRLEDEPNVVAQVRQLMEVAVTASSYKALMMRLLMSFGPAGELKETVNAKMDWLKVLSEIRGLVDY